LLDLLLEHPDVYTGEKLSDLKSQLNIMQSTLEILTAELPAYDFTHLHSYSRGGFYYMSQRTKEELQQYKTDIQDKVHQVHPSLDLRFGW